MAENCEHPGERVVPTGRHASWPEFISIEVECDVCDAWGDITTKHSDIDWADMSKDWGPPARPILRDVTLWVPGEIWSLNRQRRMHFQEQASLVRNMRLAAHMVARDAMTRHQVKPFDKPVCVTFEPHQANRGPLADTVAHAPACKAILDGLVDAKLLRDDTPKWVGAQTFLPPVRAANGKTGIRVIVDQLNPH